MSPAPRVLIAGSVLGQPMGGVRRHNQELLPRCARLLTAGGGELAILEGTEPLPAEFAALLEQAGVERIPTKIPAQPPWRRARAEEEVLRTLLASRGFDLFHTGHLPLARVDLPTTLTLHDLRDIELPSGSLVRRLAAPTLLRSAIRRARCVITVSQTVGRSIEQHFAPQRVVVVPNAADHLPEIQRTRDAQAGPLLHVGHVEARKNLELIVKALALDETLGSVVLAGAPKDGEDLRLRRLARELDVLDRIEFLGAVTDERLHELLARCSCMVLPSSLEGFGIGVLEAQRARLPLAVSTAGALPEVAGGEVPAFPPDDPDQAVRAIRTARALPTEELEASAKRAGRYTWDRSAQVLVDAWTEAASA